MRCRDRCACGGRGARDAGSRAPARRADAIPIGAFAAECVMLPREPPGRAFNAWLRAVFRAAGVELDRTLETMSAPWDRRMLPVTHGEAVSAFVGGWTREPIAGVAAVPFDPPLSFPVDLKNGQRAPLLIVGADQDHTVPAPLARAQVKKYERSPAQTDYLELEGRPHLSMIRTDRDDVAASIDGWLDGVLDAAPARSGG